jgi:hypothetical protein
VSREPSIWIIGDEQYRPLGQIMQATAADDHWWLCTTYPSRGRGRSKSPGNWTGSLRIFQTIDHDFSDDSSDDDDVLIRRRPTSPETRNKSIQTVPAAIQIHARLDTRRMITTTTTERVFQFDVARSKESNGQSDMKKTTRTIALSPR